MADEGAGETKHVPKQEGKVINLVVKDQTGAEVHFKVRRGVGVGVADEVGWGWVGCCGAGSGGSRWGGVGWSPHGREVDVSSGDPPGHLSPPQA